MTYKCCRDPDVECFLKNKALDFLNRRLTSTYLVLDKEELAHLRLKIIAYFSLTHKSFFYSEDVSNTCVKDMTSFPKKEILNNSNYDTTSSPKQNIVNAILIGQLGKCMYKDTDDNVHKYDISGHDILTYAFDQIVLADQLITCRCVFVECHSIPECDVPDTTDELALGLLQVHNSYKTFGFRFLQNDMLENGDMCKQFYMPLSRYINRHKNESYGKSEFIKSQKMEIDILDAFEETNLIPV